MTTIKKNHHVIVIHGLGRSKRSMSKLCKRLTANGYRVFNVGYPSHFGTYKEILNGLVIKVKEWARENVDEKDSINFVGHSFGGILIRGLLEKQSEWLPNDVSDLNNSRCIMLGTPNQGTAIANFMTEHFIFKHFSPKVSQELVVNSRLIANLPEPNIETGIIAGDKNFTPFIPVTWFYKKASQNAPGDGIVEIANTQCKNMTDFIVMPLHHSFMMWNNSLIEQCLSFLKHGRFDS